MIILRAIRVDVKGSDPSHVAEILAKDDGTPTSGNGAADGASGR